MSESAIVALVMPSVTVVPETDTELIEPPDTPFSVKSPNAAALLVTVWSTVNSISVSDVL